MSAAVIKQLKVNTSCVKRIHKEFIYYSKQHEKEKEQVEKMKAEGASTSDIKQAEGVTLETAMMIPETQLRLEAAYNDLLSFLSDNDDIPEGEELTAAKESLAAAEQLFKIRQE
mmetsp:Transcript_29008/g.53307  ORF Transcript_29008/g.53307 Transcript_29008/m.53307 type:complete len:114 (-) Transcript_29008:334-675(-)|eukprot:CAMPEP_0175062788 /NCGR_PEP_ID=MMETSP0052_2-20121109/14370_1 /TAXON_ID=51329 ORGANISM="Polytomella parva, Strain SAG 63-3" /NCGR_SAMPLE_ID=MMETSP0052_2 /ASSEMBLY_ACC=CAM_ASM_000194 /LENGTH=113 /DNA_ID=CAMNT_0016328863 /DNA_START=70 /DNA_END=411 /DNA_ORIENTATION=+